MRRVGPLMLVFLASCASAPVERLSAEEVLGALINQINSDG